MITSALFAGVRSGSVRGSRIGSLLMGALLCGPRVRVGSLRRSSALGECFDQERRGAVEGNAAGSQMRNVGLKHVMHALPHFESHRRSRAGCALGILARVVEQSLVATDLDQDRRQLG